MARGCIGLTAAVAAVLLCGGCERQPERPDGAPAAQQPAGEQRVTAEDIEKIAGMVREDAPGAAAGLPPGHPPLDGAAELVPDPHAGGLSPAAAGMPLRFEVPSDWRPRPPSSPMRLAEYELPADGADEPPVLAVFHFPGAGGTVEANIQRWRGQFTTADGAPIPDEATRREQLEVNGLPVTLVEFAGNYTPTMGAPGASGPRSDYRMLAAIIETPDGPWFLHVVGPDAAVARQRAAFESLVRSLRYEAGGGD